MTITDSDVKYPNKVFNYKLSTSLGYKHFKPLFNKTIFNTANNHILDFNLKGMNDSFDFIKNIGCQQVEVEKQRLKQKSIKSFFQKIKKLWFLVLQIITIIGKLVKKLLLKAMKEYGI